MEGGKKKSFATDLFGEKDKPAPPPGTFGSIFAPPPKVWGRETVNSSEAEKNGSGNQSWNSKTGGVYGGEGESKNVGSYYNATSIHYGGRDVYTPAPKTAKSSSFTTVNKDGGENDSGGASRGDWWQGSLYY